MFGLNDNSSNFRAVMFSKMTSPMIVIHGEIMERWEKFKNWVKSIPVRLG